MNTRRLNSRGWQCRTLALTAPAGPGVILAAGSQPPLIEHHHICGPVASQPPDIRGDDMLGRRRALAHREEELERLQPALAKLGTEVTP